MNASKRSTFPTHRLLMAMLVGAVISGASAVAYINSERQMPVIANIAVSTISLAVFPGYILSAYISNNIHGANLILAGVINFLLYGSLSLWLLTWRSRRKLAARPGVD
jgi:hypothetical protein